VGQKIDSIYTLRLQILYLLWIQVACREPSVSNNVEKGGREGESR
jgi:hypothetical protein